MHQFLHNQIRSINPTLKLFDKGFNNGVVALDPTLTINSISVIPTARYKAGDAGASDWIKWTYGQDLTLGATGSDPTINTGSPLIGAFDDSVKFNGDGTSNSSKLYQAAASSFGNITTEDFVFEFIYRHKAPATNGCNIANYASSGIGWQIIVTNTAPSALSIRLSDGTTTRSPFSSAITDETWCHGMLFADKDENSNNGSRIYINGIEQAAGSENNLSAITSLNVAGTFRIGGNTANSFNSNIAYFSMWQQSSWMPGGASGPTAWAAIATERFAKLTGVYPTKYSGTATPTFSRSSAAYVDKLENTSVRKLYYVYNNWPRICKRNSIDGYVAGYLPEASNTNLCLRSEDIDSSPWIKSNIASISTNSISVPNNTTTGDGIIGTSAATVHGLYQDVTITAVEHTYSIWAKAGDKTVFYLADETITNCFAYFDLSAGTVGNIGAGANTARIESWGDGWYRCSLVFTGTVASHRFDIAAAAANGSLGYTGDDVTINMYVWGAQIEANSFAYSYIPTVAASATKSLDSLYYKTDDGNIGGVGSNGTGSIWCKTLCPNVNAAATAGAFSLFALIKSSDSTNNRIYAYVSVSDVPGFAIVDGGVSQVNGAASGVDGSVNDIFDGDPHDLKVTWTTNDARVYMDKASVISDTSCTIPTNLDRLYIGANQSVGAHLVGLIYNIRVYAKNTIY